MIPKNLVPPGMGEVFIAGGYAACPALASDVDVWVSVPNGDKRALDDTRFAILQHLRDQPGFVVEEQDRENSPRMLAQKRVYAQVDTEMSKGLFLVSTFEGYHLALLLRRVATVTVEGGSLPFHIIVVAGGVDDVLSSFDISTHQIALTEKGVVRGEHWTPIWEYPVVITQKYTTSKRLSKIADRYSKARQCGMTVAVGQELP